MARRFAVGWVLIVLAFGIAGCDRCTPKTPPPSDTGAAPTLRLVVITDLKGYLEPCGCTSRPLGGIDRMAAQIKALRAEGVPLFFVAAGDLLFDGSDYGEGGAEQQVRKARTLVQILNDIGLDAAFPGPHDLAHPERASLQQQSEFTWLRDEAEPLRVLRDGTSLVLVGPRTRGVETMGPEVVVALATGGRREVNEVGRDKGVDFIVHGGLDEDEPVPPHRAKNAWVLHAGRQGQGLTVVDVFVHEEGRLADRSPWSRKVQQARLDVDIEALSEKIAAWKASTEVDPKDVETQLGRLSQMREQRAALDRPASQEGNGFVATWRELDYEAPTDRAVTALIVEHDKSVNAHNKTALAGLKPPQTEKGQASYVGSQACAACHVAAFTWWRTTEHGRAYQTLVDRHKEYNLSCVGCHVTGYSQPGGSTVTHNLDGALVNVGCESCHGPGSLHSTNPTVSMRRETEAATCVGCHNEEHSDLFDYETYRSRLIVPGHGLPVAK